MGVAKSANLLIFYHIIGKSATLAKLAIEMKILFTTLDVLLKIQGQKCLL